MIEIHFAGHLPPRAFHFEFTNEFVVLDLQANSETEFAVRDDRFQRDGGTVNATLGHLRPFLRIGADGPGDPAALPLENRLRRVSAGLAIGGDFDRA